MAKKVQFEAFLDGLVDFWQLDDQQRPLPVMRHIRYQERVVGSHRNYLAEQAGHTIRRLIRIPRADFLGRAGLFAVIGGHQYQVGQVQQITDTLPPCCDVSLEQPELLLEFDAEEAGACGRA